MKESKEVRELKDRIKDLKRDAEIKDIRYGVRIKDAVLEEQKTRLSLEKEMERLKEANVQLESQLEKAPYAQLTDLLKALAVKIPTIDLKSLTVTAKGNK
jgi:hypothetical protein